MKPILVIILVIIIIVVTVIAFSETPTNSSSDILVQETNNVITKSSNTDVPLKTVVAVENKPSGICNGIDAPYSFIGDHIKPGSTLKSCQGLQSPDKNTILVMQSYGNLVLYDKVSGKVLWSTDTGYKNGKLPFRFQYQTDGNLVLYDVDDKPIWSSNTHGKASTRFNVENDANAVIYNDVITPGYTGQIPVWSYKGVYQTKMSGVFNPKPYWVLVPH